MIIREPLKEGTIIRDRDTIYTIKKKIGEGASCLVYDADFVDDQGIIYKVRIKECFPINYSLSRRADGNIIGDEEGLEKAKTRFKASYERLVDLRNNNKKITNYIVVPIRLFEANNTMYSVFPVDVGKNYGQLLEESFANKGNCTLKDAMVRFNKIANVVLQFHEANALCLDIKPQNIFILDTKPEIVKLFDFDSVATIHEGQNSLEYVSFSNGFAAPEQLTGDKDNISKKTDVYALGAMLYYVLFGKHYDCLDEINDVGIEYNTMLYPDYRPAFAEELQRFFDMTLAIWPEERGEMAEVLNQIDNLINVSNSISSLNYWDDMAEENQMIEEFGNATIETESHLFPRYFTLAHKLGLQTGLADNTLAPIYCNVEFLKYIVQQCTYAMADIKNLQQELRWLIMINFKLFEITQDEEYYQECHKFFREYVDNKFDASPKFFADYADYRIKNSTSHEDLISSVQEVFAAVYCNNFTACEDCLKQLFVNACNKCNEFTEDYIYLTLFKCLYVEDIFNNETFFREAENRYMQSGLKNSDVEKAIVWVAEQKEYSTTIRPHDYNAEKTRAKLKKMFPRFIL